MLENRGHLEDLTLEAWVAGSLIADDNLLVEQHLEACHACAERLEALETPEDALVLRLREIQQADLSEPTNAQSDANLLFGILAIQASLISRQQFLDACMLWSSRQSSSLAEVLTQQGWLSASDRQVVQQLFDRRIATSPVKTAPVKQNYLKETSQGSHYNTVALPPLSAEKLELKELYSTGGIGQIWVAYDHILGREVALKELLPEKTGSPTNRERFFREARVTAQLTHPGTPPVYEFVEEEGRCWYTMKFIHGQTLSKVIEQYHLDKSNHGDALAQLIQLLNYFVAACNTIAYAHSKQILHRDLKGENVLVGDFGEVIVLDWGLAKQIDDQRLTDPIGDFPITPSPHHSDDPAMTVQGERLGTPAYMAPEQARGLIDEIDYRTDVYGLAALLYEILTGQPPFAGEDVRQVMLAVQHHPPTPPCEIVADVPAELAELCLQGLAKNRDERQQSAAEIGTAVQSWIVQLAQRKRTDQERELFFNLSQDLLAIHDKELRLRQTNPAWETILGWTREDLEQMTILDLLHPEEHEIFAQRRASIRAGNPASKLEHRCRCKDGSYKWIRWSTTRIQKEELGYSVGHDISDIKGPCE